MRTLKPYEIEIRVGTVSSKKPSAMLLLYKDARCDMSILDETYGNKYWQSEYCKIDGVLYCKIGVYNKDTKEWVWKQSNGIESQGTGAQDPNNVKGEASDAFKRAGFMWGIGRELYEWKGIWVNYDKAKDKYTDYKVTEISYDKNREPQSITITGNDKVVYQVKNGKRVYKPNQKIKTAKKANNDEPNTVEDNRAEHIEEEIINEIRKENREIWNALMFETTKIVARLGEYETEDNKGVAKEYLMDFIKMQTKKPFDKLEFAKQEQAPSLKGYEVVVIDSKFEVQFENYVKDNETEEPPF